MSNLICEKCVIRDCECVPYDVECDSCIRAYKQGRADAIDGTIHILKHRNTTILQNGYEYHGYTDDELDEIAEEMKGGTEE